MPDVNFLPIYNATFEPATKILSVYFTRQQLKNFESSTIRREGRRAFEQRQSKDHWADVRIEDFFRRGERHTLRLADEDHPLRFGGSALTILEIASGPLQGRYWVGTARYTNRSIGRGRTLEEYPDLGRLKNAGGLPSTLEEHLNPGRIGEKEGVEELAFCCAGQKHISVLCPVVLEVTTKDALVKSIERLNYTSSPQAADQRSLTTASDGTKFKYTDSESYALVPFPPTGHTLRIYEDTDLKSELPNVVLSWTPRYSALEVATSVFRLAIRDGDGLTGLLTADGPDGSLGRFAEDIYVATLHELCARNEGDAVSVYQLNTTEFPNWPPTSTINVLYRPADGLQDLLDAVVGRYSFTSSLRRAAKKG